jgi:hypothetical protein
MREDLIAMLFRLAIKTLLSDRGKLVAAVIGVTFSVVLANVQGEYLSPS